jgi:hypothetical protein
MKLTNLERCSFLQRKIILHSIIYYELNENIISDQQFDKMCRSLLKGIQYTKDYKRSDYFYVFYDFDGTTGFNLYHRLEDDDKEYLMNLAKYILKLSKKENKKNEKRKY